MAISEKTGPDNLDIGGSRGPEIDHILKYSPEFGLLEKQTGVEQRDLGRSHGKMLFISKRGGRSIITNTLPEPLGYTKTVCSNGHSAGTGEVTIHPVI